MMCIELFENNARYLFRKSHTPNAPFSYVKDVTTKEAAKETEFIISYTPTPDLDGHQSESVNENRSVFVEKLEDIGMVDPAFTYARGPPPAAAKPGASAAKTSTISPAPSKKKDPSLYKPQLKNIDFGKFVYPDCKMNNN